MCRAVRPETGLALCTHSSVRTAPKSNEKRGIIHMIWTLITFIGFTILVAVIAYLKTKDDDQTTAEGYFLAGRGLPGIVIAGSLLLTNISAEQLVGTNGQTWATNMSPMAYAFFLKRIYFFLLQQADLSMPVPSVCIACHTMIRLKLCGGNRFFSCSSLFADANCRDNSHFSSSNSIHGLLFCLLCLFSKAMPLGFFIHALTHGKPQHFI